MRRLAHIMQRTRRLFNAVAAVVAGPWAGNPIGPETAQVFGPTVVDWSWLIPNSGITLDTESAQAFSPSIVDSSWLVPSSAITLDINSLQCFNVAVS